MYGKAPKMSDFSKAKKATPMPIKATVKNTKPMPSRGSRTAKNIMSRGKK